jgi:hypothetical protein
MELKNIAKLRRFAASAVAANVAIVGLAALALPSELMGVLPVLALTLPLLTTSLVERVALRGLDAAALT